VLALIVLRSQDFRGHNRNPRLASPGSTTEVETVHPLLSCPAGMNNLPAIPEPYTHNTKPPTQIPGRTRPAAVGKISGLYLLMDRPAFPGTDAVAARRPCRAVLAGTLDH
jgi:hypothetical protein